MYKTKRLLAMSLAFVLVFSLLPTIKAHANTGVDLIGDSTPTSVGTIQDGVSYVQTGYLCYLLTSDGRAVSGTRAYAFSCPNFNTITRGGTPVFRATSRKGNYSASSWTGVAPWSCSPFNADRTTNAEIIRAWMKAPFSGDVPNGQQFVKDLWGDACRDKFKSGDYILVIETIMHFRYSFDYTYKSLSVDEWKAVIKAKYPDIPDTPLYTTALSYSTNTTEYRAPFGPSVIGTVRDCLNYQSVAYSVATANTYIDVKSYNLFSKYLNQVAPFAERIGAGSAGERAGFSAWTGGIDSRLSDSQVNQYGVAMLVISALEDDIVGSSGSGEEVTPTTYDGTIYTLTSAGGSQSSGGSIGSFAGGSASDTTSLGWGSGDSCAIGSLYAENCATGDEPYALADSMKRGMSYEGDVPAVVMADSHLFLCSKIEG